jgi:hypothetical protein
MPPKKKSQNISGLKNQKAVVTHTSITEPPLAAISDPCISLDAETPIYLSEDEEWQPPVCFDSLKLQLAETDDGDLDTDDQSEEYSNKSEEIADLDWTDLNNQNITESLFNMMQGFSDEIVSDEEWVPDWLQRKKAKQRAKRKGKCFSYLRN